MHLCGLNLATFLSTPHIEEWKKTVKRHFLKQEKKHNKMLFFLLESLELREQSEMHFYRVYNVCGDDSRLNLHTQLAWGATLGHLNDGDSISRMNKTQRLLPSIS